MTIAIIITAVIVADLLLTWLLIWGLLRGAWSPLMQRYPAQPVAADAITRNFQSFKFGMVNLGCAIHVSADEKALHLTPAKFIRWFGGETVSIPWDAITVRSRSRNGKWVTASLNGTTLMGPAWCLDLAEPPREDDAGSTTPS